MDHRSGQLDVPHSLSAYSAMSDLDAAAVADHPFVFHAAVLTTGAFPVFFRPEDSLTEKAVTLWSIRSVVNGFRFFDFTK